MCTKKLLTAQVRSFSANSESSIVDESEIDETYTFVNQFQHFKGTMNEEQKKMVAKKLYTSPVPNGH